MSLKHQLGWLHGFATYACAQNGPILGLMPCCCCLKILYTFQTKAPHCHFLVGSANYVVSPEYQTH